MANVDTMQLFGMLFAIAVFSGIGIYSGKKVKTKNDYYVAGSSFGALSVAGTAAGLQVGSGTIIGTAQLAFTDGFSAIYFALGTAIAMIIMGVGLAGRIRRGGLQTIQEMVRFEYGSTACMLATVLGILGFYINNISHFLSGISLIGSVLPLSTLTSSLIIGALILVCVCMGGFWGLSLINFLKTTILTLVVVTAAVAIFMSSGHYAELAAELPERYFTLFPRGANKDFGNFLSVMLGIMSTQTTMQCIFSAREVKDSRIGMFLGASLVPIVGFCSTIIGMYMRTVAPDIPSLQAFPRFVMMHTNGFVSGVILATALMAVATAGVSVMLAIAGILVNNIYVRIRPNADNREQLRFSRLAITGLLLLSITIINTGASDSIMQYSFLSMGLRSAVLFLPMMCAMFLPGKISPRFAIASIILGPVSLLLGKFAIPLPFDCIFFGLMVNCVIMLLGAFDKKRTTEKKAD